MPDDFVQVPPDSTGKKIDNATVTTGAGSVERQRVAIGDAIQANSAVVTGVGAQLTSDLLTVEILFELKKITLALQLLCLDHGISIDLEGAVI